MLKISNAENAGELTQGVTFFVIERGAAEACDAVRAVHRDLAVLLLKGRVAGVFNSSRDARQCLFPAYFFP